MADIGSTPLGFQYSDVVGGVTYKIGVIGASVFALAVLCRDGEICGSE